MGKLDIRQSIEVNTTTEKAWEIVGPNFLRIEEWGRGINKSWKNDDAQQKFTDAPAGGRFCEVSGFGTFDERIVHYDTVNTQIAWSATGAKLPKFVSGLKNELSVEKIDENNCRISSNVTADFSGLFGLIMGPLMKKNFSKTLYGFLNDWKTYAETGKVSETKSKELKRGNK